MVKKAISQIKAGPSGIVVEMIRAAGDIGTSMIRDRAAAMTFVMARYLSTGSRV